MPATFLLRLLGIGKWLHSAAGSLFSAVRAYPLQAALIAAVLACGWLWHGWSHEKAKHLADNDRFTAQIFAMDSASKANAAELIARNKAWEAKTDTLAKDNRNVEADLRARYGALNVAYADRMRTDKVCVRPTTPAGQSDPAPIGDSAGPSAVMVSRADFDILTGNTARLEAVHDWGEQLIQAGLAVPAR